MTEPNGTPFNLNINPVAATDIVYHYRKIKSFKITSFKNIGRAQVDGQVIHLHDIAANASICVTAEINVIEKPDADIYVINSSPYHLKFFDGYK